MMNARPKKKLCWNCEGSVAVNVETCPYCGVSVAGLSAEIAGKAPAAPYRLVSSVQESSIPVPPYAQELPESGEEPDGTEDAEEQAPAESKVERDDSKNVVLVLFLLLLGSVCFIFGFALLLFSNEGYLTLHWNANYWFLYLLLAFPLLYLGFRKLNTLP
jgi:hypothetical protein